MFKNSSKILFSGILIAGTLLTVSSNSWLGSWMGLEINLLSFIPLMNNTKNLMSTESSLKYFLIQALASSALLMAIILSMLNTNSQSIPSPTENLPNMIILLSLLLKSGAAPLHFWFPSVMEGLTWMNSLILMTWQKIGPMMLLSYLIITNIIISSIIMSVVIGSLGGLNQSSLRKLMAYSSINHIGWMLTAMLSSEEMWSLYFVMYSLLSSALIMIFNTFKIFYFNQLFNMFFSSKALKFMLFMNLLSLGGLPPFMGFLPKWMVIQYLTLNNQIMLLTIMVTFTLVTLFFYLRMAFSAFMLNYFESNWYYSMNMTSVSTNLYMISSYMSVTGLLIISMIYFTM